MEILSDVERQEALKKLDGWSVVEGRNAIRRILAFRNFNDAWGFMTRVALIAAATDHYPEWSNVWNRVDTLLSTHEVGGVTLRDINLAHQIDDFVLRAVLQRHEPKVPRFTG